MLPARHQCVFSILLLIISAKTTGDFLQTNHKRFSSFENIFRNKNGGPIIAVAVVKDKPILRSYVPENIPRISKTNNLPQTQNDNEKGLELFAGVDDEESDEFLGLKLTEKQKNMLRKSWRSTCDKAAAKTCKKACYRARKRACDAYHCKKSISKIFKKECKESCKHYFLSSKSEDRSSDDDSY